MRKTILITGGAGFIGSHVVRLFVSKYSDYRIVNLDLLTYSGNLENLKDIENEPNYTFVKGDIADGNTLKDLFNKWRFDGIINLAAETHVDRSITNPNAFIQTNIIGTATLLNIAVENWKNNFQDKIFYQISTDEVYGSLDDDTRLFTECTPYNPQSPYSASKASADHLVRAYGNTYGLPYMISNCSNNYGPNQFPEKLIPLIINNIQNNKSLPIYGDGKHSRDWLYVIDHVKAIDLIFHHGCIGQTYNIGAFNEYKNIDLVKLICQKMDEKLNRPIGKSEQLIKYIKDRQGHDRRYAIDATKLNKELSWFPTISFDEGLSQTIDWYLNNQTWLNNVTNGNYQQYYQQQYGNI